MKVFMEMPVLLMLLVLQAVSGEGRYNLFKDLDDALDSIETSIDKLFGSKSVLDEPLRKTSKAKQHIIQGDIVVVPRDEDGGNDKRSLNVHARWPNDIVFYKFSADFTGNDEDSTYRREMIYKAMDTISNLSCVTFKEHKAENYWLNFVSGGGCSSYVGRIPSFMQPQNVTYHPYCFNSFGTIVHELLHAMGFAHEQSRPDRDEYVEILWENIRSGRENNFRKDTDSVTLGRNYDYQSVMHYGSTAFSKNGRDTIEPIEHKYSGQLGQRRGPSNGDIIDINLIYECVGKTNYVGEWTEFDPCTTNCTKSRQRFCGKTADCPYINEKGLDTDIVNCSYEECYAPVNGHWGHWSEFSCTKTCGREFSTRTRTCTNPRPKNGGRECSGNSTETGLCNLPLCEAQCGGEYHATEQPGYIYSPGYPTNYPANQRCTYRIEAPDTHFVKLTFESFWIEASPMCGYDSASIYDYEAKISTLCGKKTENVVVRSTSNTLVIVFTSDVSEQFQGFKATFVDGTTNQPLPTQHPAYSTRLPAPDVYSTQSPTPDVYSTQSPTPDVYSTQSPTPDVYSTQSPTPDVYSTQSPTPDVYSTQSPTVHCGGQYYARGTPGYIFSPGYPFRYPNNLNCTYRINSVPGTFVQLNFLSFALEESTSCGWDSVSIYYDSQKETKIAKKCHNSSQSVFLSNTSEMVFVFKTDGSIQRRGFMAKFVVSTQEPTTQPLPTQEPSYSSSPPVPDDYSTKPPTPGFYSTRPPRPACGNEYSATSSPKYITSPRYPSHYPPDQDCEYHINAPADMSIKLTFTDLRLEYVRGCYYDYVKIYYDDDKKNEIATLCGRMSSRRLIKPFHSTGSMVVIVFRSDYSRQRKGFRVEFELME